MRDGRALVLSDYVGGGAAAGGAGLAALDSFRALRAAGVDARLLAGFGEVPAVEPGRFASLRGRDLRDGGSADAARAVWNRAAAASLGRALADEDPESTVVMLHQWTRWLSPAALLPLRPYPVMVYCHDYFWSCPNGAYYDFAREEPCARRPLGPACALAQCDRAGTAVKLGRLARAGALKGAAGPPSRRLFLHLSDHARRVAAPLLPGEEHAVVHNPLDVPAAPPARLPAQFGVGYFGRLEPEKGVDLLADAAADLGLRALFAGQGRLADALGSRSGATVAGWRSRAEAAALMRRCAAVALPSRWDETWGLVVAEAMAAGVPVLASARAGSSELVRRFGGGAVFDPGRPGDLAAKLAALLASPPGPVERWDAFRRYLSPARHAERLVELAGARWGISLRPLSASRLPPPTARAAPRARARPRAR